MSCGGPKDPRKLTRAGEEALASGDYDAAARYFSDALAAIGNDPARSEYSDAKLGHAESLIRADPKKAKEEFLALAREKPETIQDREFNAFASKLGDANNLVEATEVLTVGIEAFPESPHLVALRDALGDRAKASSDGGALEALKGLGYVGE